MKKLIIIIALSILPLLTVAAFAGIIVVPIVQKTKIEKLRLQAFDAIDKYCGSIKKYKVECNLSALHFALGPHMDQK